MKLTGQIKNRFTGEIMCGGLTLKVVIENHRKWLYSEAGGERANLSSADLSSADLRSADLSSANLSSANLSSANLRSADLRSADLRSAPFKIKNIHQAVYHAARKHAALDMTTWHSCETTHCRAGWVVTLAGDAGRTLEWSVGTPRAAALIYLASDPDIGKMPDFYCGNEAALEDMRLRAEKEAEKGAA